jgi:hypothetical protein
MNEQPQDKPKIVVDTDWKSQVEAEKERLRREEQQQQPGPGAVNDAPRSAPRSETEEEQLPQASLAFLVTSLATQAMVALGQIPDPFENKSVVRLAHARHHIDMLGVLEEKTQGNLTPEEKSLLAHVLTDLRMAYVAVETHVKRSGK